MKKFFKESILISIVTISCLLTVELVSYSLIGFDIKVQHTDQSHFDINSFRELRDILDKKVAVEDRVFMLASRLKDWGIFDYETLEFERKNIPPSHLRDLNRIKTDNPSFSFFHNISPNFSGEVTLFKKNSEEHIYSAFYTINEFGWRVTSEKNKNFTRKQSLLFWGCSFTFGEGLNDNETFTSVLSKNLNIKTYNLGIPGASPARFAYALEHYSDDLIFDESDQNEKINFYVFMNDHIRRVMNNPEKLNDEFHFNNEPQFYLEEGKLKSVSSLSEYNALENLIVKVLSKSFFLKILNLSYPTIDKETVKLFGKVVAKLRDEIQARHPTSKDFYVIFWPGHHFFNSQIKEELKNNNIKYLDYGGLNIHELLRSRETQIKDGHPSVTANNLLAFLIEKDLEGILEQ